MADMTDVADALVGVIVALAYPDGMGQPSATSAPVKVYQGWPNPDTLERDLAAGGVHVSVYPRPGSTTTSVIMGDEQWDEQANTATRELRRQQQQFQITIWAGTPAGRDALAKVIDPGLAALSRLPLPDGAVGILTYVNSRQDDGQQTSGVYRRDLIYAVDYPAAQTEQQTAITSTIVNTSLDLALAGAFPLALGVSRSTPPV